MLDDLAINSHLAFTAERRVFSVLAAVGMLPGPLGQAALRSRTESPRSWATAYPVAYNPAMPTIALVVTGRVQGVGFRAFVCRQADYAGLRGEVWNSGGGTVEVIAQHDDAKVLEAFREKLALGPGRVDSVLGGFVDVPTVYEEFSVTFGSG